MLERIAFACFAAFFLALFIYGISKIDERTKACREAGGIPYHNANICLNPSAIVELK